MPPQNTFCTTEPLAPTRCKACRASLDAVRTALARPANAAARPVGALALEVCRPPACHLHTTKCSARNASSKPPQCITQCIWRQPGHSEARPSHDDRLASLFLLQRAARSSEPFMRCAAAAITASGRASCRRASEPVAPQQGGGRSARRGSTPAPRAASMQLALDSIRCLDLCTHTREIPWMVSARWAEGTMA